MSYRFFHTQPPVEDRFTLIGDQAHHAINVMRYREGDRIVIFDGQGIEHDAEIETLTKKQLTARLLETRQVDRSLPRDITMVVALPKGDRQKFLIEKLVELGVTKLVPLATRRSVAEVKPKVIERIEKQIIEASKQCGRNFLMQVTPPRSVAQLCESPDEDEGAGPQAEQKSVSGAVAEPRLDAGTLRLVAHPYDALKLSSVNLEPAQPIAFAIGPEGGFTEDEVQSLIQAGWRPVSLGPMILRIETAAVAAATIFGIGADDV